MVAAYSVDKTMMRLETDRKKLRKFTRFPASSIYHLVRLTDIQHSRRPNLLPSPRLVAGIKRILLTHYALRKRYYLLKLHFYHTGWSKNVI